MRVALARASREYGDRVRHSHRGPIDFGSYVADYIHMLASIEIFSKYDAARTLEAPGMF